MSNARYSTGNTAHGGLPLRICLLTKEYPAETAWGGISTFSYHLAHGLHEIGHEVEVVTLSAKHSDWQQTREIDDAGVKVFRAPWPGGFDKLDSINRASPYSHFMFKTNLTLWRLFLERHQQKPFDILDTPELLGEGLLPGLNKLLAQVIRLYTPHSKFIHDELNDISSTFDHELIATMERTAMLQADALTSPSRDLAKFVAADLGIPVEDITIIGNPIEIPGADESGARNSENIQKVLFVGRFEQRKGIDYLAQAMPAVIAACPNAHFIFLGADTATPAGKSKVEQIKSMLQSAGCLQQASFVPRVSLQELQNYYRNCDIFVAPSLYDNSPYTCLEAMSCGAAVIGTSAGGTAEYIENGVSGLIVPARDADSLAKAIIKLLKDPHLRANMGLTARQQVKERYDRKQIARQTVELYDKAMSRYRQHAQTVFYRHEPSKLIYQATDLMMAYDRMFADLLYTECDDFRLRHWAKMIFHRPRLTASKFAARLLGRICAGFGRVPDAVTRLQTAVSRKDDERIESLRQEVLCK